MFRTTALVSLASGLLAFTAAPAEAGCQGYSGYHAGYSSGPHYGVRTTNPYAYQPIGRRAGVGYGAYYGSNRGYGYQPYYGRGGYRSPYYQRSGRVIAPSARGGYGSTYYRSGGFGSGYRGYGTGYRGYGTGYRGYGTGYGGYGTGYGGYGYGAGSGVSIGLGF